MEYKNCGEPTIIHKNTLYNCDCMELLKETPDNYYDLAICDPPYGIGFDKENETMSAGIRKDGTHCLNSIRICKVLWAGYKKQEPENRIHPTQKPVALYKWLLKNYAKEGDKILDTHLGSMSIAIACHYMGFELTGCELDKEYFDAGIERVTNQTRQQTLL